MSEEIGGSSDTRRKKGKFSDLFSVIAVAVLLVVAFVGGGLFVHAHGVSDSWIFIGMVCVGLAILFGWQVRPLFKRRLFLPYFVVWIIAETVGITRAIRDYGTVAALPVMLILIFLGYTLTFWLFGVPPNLKRK